MSYCLNPHCQKPQNPPTAQYCQGCGLKLLLREHYRPIKPLGQGGFGKTFLAIDEDRLQTPCVIKQFFPQDPSPRNAQKAAELFHQEAIRLDQLGQHPQIPDLLAHFEQDSYQYLVQEFIDGAHLDRELQTEGVFNEAKIRHLLQDLLPVLQFIHQAGVIHRDIKPENIIRCRLDRRLVLVDFGAAKLFTQSALLRRGTLIGSPEYMAPEQIEGQATFASDIYSLGVTCIYLLTNTSPFNLRDRAEDCWVWQDYLPTPISSGLTKILEKMIARPTSQRYESAAQVLSEFNSLINSLHYTVDSLALADKRLVAQQIFAPNMAASIPAEYLTAEIYQFLQNTAQIDLNKPEFTEWQILSLWRQNLLEIVEKLSVEREYEKDKALFLNDLREFGKDEHLGQKMREIAKDVALLIYNALDEKEQAEFWEKVLEDLKNNQINVAADAVKQAGIKGILFGSAGLPGLMVSVVARVMLHKLTQGLLTGILLNWLARHALSRAALGVLGGPIGVGINVILAAGGVVHGVSFYRQQKRKAKFIQGIFSVYLLAS